MWTWLRTLPRLLPLQEPLFFSQMNPPYTPETKQQRDHPGRGYGKHEDHTLVVTTLGVTQNHDISLQVKTR